MKASRKLESLPQTEEESAQTGGGALEQAQDTAAEADQS